MLTQNTYTTCSSKKEKELKDIVDLVIDFSGMKIEDREAFTERSRKTVPKRRSYLKKT